MTYRLCPDESWLAFAMIDTPEMVETEAVVECGERHLKLLAELADLGMELARKIVQNAAIPIEATSGDGDARKPPADPAKAFSTIAQAVRRTVALEARLAEEVKTLRGGLLAKRTERSANLMRAQSEYTAGAVHDAPGSTRLLSQRSGSVPKTLIRLLRNHHLPQRGEGWLPRARLKSASGRC